MNRKLRRAGFVSLTLGAIGCGEPKEEAALRPKELFSSDTVTRDSRKGEGWRRFLAPAELHRAWVPVSRSPWRPYYKPTLIAAVATVESAAMPMVNVGMPPAMEEAQRYAATLRPGDTATVRLGDTAIFVDLIGEQSVVWAAALRQSGFVPVVAINNWPHQFGILRLERPLGALLYYADEVSKTRLPADAPPVFVLERSRLAKKDLVPSSNQFDNRYFHAHTDFPTAEEFKKRGILNVVYINPRGVTAGCEEDDLAEYFTALAANGIQFTYVRSHTSGFDVASVQPSPRDTIFSKPAIVAYTSTPNMGTRYYHSYYHYSLWHSSSYWDRSSGAWGGSSAASGWTHSSGGGGGGFSS